MRISDWSSDVCSSDLLAKAGVATAEATRGAASGQLAANDALVRGSTIDTDPAVLAAKAKLENARLDLDRSVIRAPIDGVVTRRSVQVGQRVAQGSPIMPIVPLAKIGRASCRERVGQAV